MGDIYLRIIIDACYFGLLFLMVRVAVNWYKESSNAGFGSFVVLSWIGIPLFVLANIFCHNTGMFLGIIFLSIVIEGFGLRLGFNEWKSVTNKGDV